MLYQLTEGLSNIFVSGEKNFKFIITGIIQIDHIKKIRSRAAFKDMTEKQRVKGRISFLKTVKTRCSIALSDFTLVNTRFKILKSQTSSMHKVSEICIISSFVRTKEKRTLTD